jgi:glutaredoxin 3
VVRSANHVGWCPYCRQTKQTLTEFGASFQVYELDQIDDGEEIQAYLGTKTGQRTVPNVFIEQKHIGGNSDVQKIKNGGTLKELLVHAGAATS